MNQFQMAYTLPVFAFFAQYPTFVYNPTTSIYAQFDRLNRLLHWSTAQRAEAQAQLHRAMAEQFNYTYGRDPDSLLAWQRLCLVLAIYPIPSDIAECRKRVCATFVNIYDLLLAPWLGFPPLFVSEEALSTYTLKKKKVFPRGEVHRGSLLEYLLRHIYHPSRDGKQRVRSRSSS